MADYTITKISGNTALELHLELTESTNTTANTSTYTYRLYIKKIANSGYSYNTNNQAYLTIAGTAILATTNWGSINLSGLGIGGEFNLVSGTTSAIAHNSDGSGSISVYAKFQQPNGTGAVHMEQTFSVTMTSIPRASKPTAGNGIIGNTVTINTNRASSSFTHTIQYKIGSSGYTTIATGVGNSVSWTLPATLANYITDASNGTVTINCITYSGSTQIGTATTTMVATIPNSTLTCDTSGINMGAGKTIGVTNTCSAYLTVSVTATMGSVSRSVRTSFGSGSFTFDVATWAPAIPSAVSGTVTVTQTTKRGTKTINTTTKSFTLTLPTGNRAPVLSAANVTDPKGYATTYGYYLSGKSQIKVTLTASPSAGASLNYYSITIPGIGSYTSNGVTVDVPASLASDNAKSITAKVRDTRYGATQLEGSASTVIKVLKYTAPSISATVVRSDSSGTANPSAGTYIRIRGSVSWTTITGGSSSNSIAVKYRTRQQNGSWSGYTNLTLSNSNAFDVTVGTFSYEVGWDVQIVATDSVTTGGVTNSYTVGSAVFPIDVYPSQNSGVAFGKVATTEGVVDSAWRVNTSKWFSIDGGGGNFFGHSLIGASGSKEWLCLGTLSSAGDSSNTIIDVYTGNGYNANAYQNVSFRIFIKDAWQSSQSAGSSFGVTVTFNDRFDYTAMDEIAVKVIASAHNVCKVWVYLPWTYWNGNYTVTGRFGNWTHSGDHQADEPTGTAQNVQYIYPYTSYYPQSTMPDGLFFQNATMLPNFSAAPTILLGIESFANGGQVKWVNSSVAYVGYLKPSGDGAFTTDANGNFTHKRTTTTDYWHLNNNAGTAKFSVYWETGVVNVASGGDYRVNSASIVPIKGGNASSGYIRFPNVKIQIAWKKLTWTGAITTAWGNSFESTAVINLGNWSAAFSEEPRVAMGATTSAGTAGTAIEFYGKPTTTAAGSVYLFRPTSMTSQTWWVYVIGIGAYS